VKKLPSDLKSPKKSSARRTASMRAVGAATGQCPTRARPAHSPAAEVRGGGPQALQAQKERSRSPGPSAHHSAPVLGVIFGPKPRSYAVGHEPQRASARPAYALIAGPLTSA